MDNDKELQVAFEGLMREQENIKPSEMFDELELTPNMFECRCSLCWDEF